jgi:hypothetical protein
VCYSSVLAAGRRFNKPIGTRMTWGTDGGRDNQSRRWTCVGAGYGMDPRWDIHDGLRQPRSLGGVGAAGFRVVARCFVRLSSQRLAMLLPIMTTPITSRTTTMIVTLFSTSHSRSLSNGPRIRADATR